MSKIVAAKSKIAKAGAAVPDAEFVKVRNLKTYFPIKGGVISKVVAYVRAVDGISFNIRKGTTMGLVGESGCGKTTAGRTMLRLCEKTDGHVFVNGVDVHDLTKHELREARPMMQYIFQDPYSSLSPRLPVGEIIGEAVAEHKLIDMKNYDAYIEQIMVNCGLQPYHKNRYPHEFSGGQRQRICIARSLALNPDFVVCDEPVSALDVSIQAQIINLLMDLQEEHNLTYLFISHDLSVVEHISDSVGVMYLGNLVETGSKERIFANPLHPYTKALFSAIPVPDPDYKMNKITLTGSIPSPAAPPLGCKFHTRCSECMEICKTVKPKAYEVEPGHIAVCHLFSDYPEAPHESETFPEDPAQTKRRERIERLIAELDAKRMDQAKAAKKAKENRKKKAGAAGDGDGADAADDKDSEKRAAGAVAATATGAEKVAADAGNCAAAAHRGPQDRVQTGKGPDPEVPGDIVPGDIVPGAKDQVAKDRVAKDRGAIEHGKEKAKLDVELEKQLSHPEEIKQAVEQQELEKIEEERLQSEDNLTQERDKRKQVK